MSTPISHKDNRIGYMYLRIIIIHVVTLIIGITNNYRNPGTSPRPSFRELVLTIVGNQQLVLAIPQDSIETHQLAGVLGAPLETGENMYQDLQYIYVNQGSTNDRDNEHDNDYEEFD